MASANTSISKEDPTVQLWDFVQENLLQFHCENVSWEQASDKIPIKVVVELLGDLITHVNTCLLLRNNRLLFTLNWDTFENGPVVWEHLNSFHLNQKRRLETPQYQCDFMLTSVSSYPDLVDIYCYAGLESLGQSVPGHFGCWVGCSQSEAFPPFSAGNANVQTSMTSQLL